MEKEIWKWILNSFSDEGIANLAQAVGIKIPGFRQVNPQHKKFKIVRPKIIHAALQQELVQKFHEFIESFAEEKSEIDDLKDKSFEELLEMVGEEIQPSIVLGVLLSSQDEEHQEKAVQLYTKLKEEDKLELLEQQADEKANEIEHDDIKDHKAFVELKSKLQASQQVIDKLEKRLAIIEQKNEELKSKEAKAQAALKTEKKRSKEEKAVLSQEINSLKGEVGSLKHQVKSISPEKDLLSKQIDSQKKTLKNKDEEINRLNALTLKLRTDLEKFTIQQEKLGTTQENVVQNSPKVKVVIIGDPKNTRIRNYHKYELFIVEGTELPDEETLAVIANADQVWLLTYKVPRSTQKHIRNLVKSDKTTEFSTFVELEDYMLKGMV